MKRWMQNLAMIALALSLTAAVSALPEDEVRLSTGDTWRLLSDGRLRPERKETEGTLDSRNNP